MTDQNLKHILSRIIELERENTSLIFNGHKPSENDSFEPKRKELTTLRCIYFGYDSKFCKIKKGFN
jgi:hypothetical protein